MIEDISADTAAPDTFGDQTFRVSNAITSGSFDHTYSASLEDEAGETSAENGGMSGGERQNNFESSFEFTSADISARQEGLVMSISPDRGDGARMSFIELSDQEGGLRVRFSDYQRGAVESDEGANFCNDTGCFVFTTLAENLDRDGVYTVNIVMDFVDGESNDIVTASVSDADSEIGSHTGTSWEDYFRDVESNPTRTVDSMLFITRGTAAPDTSGEGFFIDNFSMESSTIERPLVVDEDGLANIDENGNVDCDATVVAFNTIQGAVDAAAAGDTVEVCPGTYNEAAIRIDKALTVNGAGAENTIIDGGNTVLGGSAIPGQVDIRATGDVNFSGFTIQNAARRSNTSQIYTIFAQAPSGNPTYTISDNVIIGVNNSSVSGDNGFYTDSSTDTLVFTGNEISGTAGNAMGIEEHPNAATVTGNTLTAGSAANRTGLTVFPVRVNVADYEISDNTVDANNKYGIRVFAGSTGTTTPASATVTGIDITDNTVTNADIAAITLENADSNASGALGNISEATVTGNSLTGDGTLGDGVRVTGLVTEPDISGNAITDFARGIFVDDATAGGHSPTGIDANQNRLFGNATAGITNDTPDTAENIDATNNWWGCNEGPVDGADCAGITGTNTTTGAGVKNGVDFDPWLVLTATANPASVPTGGESTVTASLRTNSDDELVTPFILPDVGNIDFTETTGLGTLEPPTTVEIMDGEATVEFTANNTVGTAEVDADHDNATATAEITITGPGEPGDGSPAVCREPGAIVGDDDPNTLNGTEENDVICGLGGDDTINGLGGDDTLIGGEGADTIDGLGGDDDILGNEGDDVLRGGDGADAITGAEGQDDLFGGVGPDVLRGGDQLDQLYGGAGGDTLLGQEGPDELFGQEGPDNLNGGAGIDDLFGGVGNDSLNAIDGLGGDLAQGGPNVDSCFTDRGDRRIACE